MADTNSGSGGEKLGNKDTTWLIRFVRDTLEQQSTQNYQQIAAEQVTVNDALILKDRLVITKDPYFHNVGGTGNAAFTNAWVNWGSPYNPAGYWKDALGFVHLRGVIKLGTIGTSAFTLPPGYRPANNLGPLAVMGNDIAIRLDVKSDGTVTPFTTNVYVTLDNITFKVT